MKGTVYTNIRYITEKWNPEDIPDSGAVWEEVTPIEAKYEDQDIYKEFEIFIPGPRLDTWAYMEYGIAEDKLCGVYLYIEYPCSFTVEQAEAAVSRILRRKKDVKLESILQFKHRTFKNKNQKPRHLRIEMSLFFPVNRKLLDEVKSLVREIRVSLQHLK